MATTRQHEIKKMNASYKNELIGLIIVTIIIALFCLFIKYAL